MARIRSVHPNICVSETMATLPAELERTFVRLWTHCDDYGRALDNARLIKAALYPLNDEMTPERVDKDLDQLVRVGFIRRYEVDGRRYLVVVNWDTYQKPQKKVDSKLPEPPEHVEPPTRPLREPSGSTPVTLLPSYASGEGVGGGEGEVVIAAKSPRKRDELWEAMLVACGIDGQSITSSARGGYNKARSDLAAVGATPDEISRRAEAHRAKWPEISVTPNSLARHWAELDAVDTSASALIRRQQLREGRA